MAVKTKAAKGGLRFGRRKFKRTPAGTAVLYGRALVGDKEAREELQSAAASARKAYKRGSDKEAGRAAQSLSRALRIAGRKREKPRSAKGPAIALAAAAGAGAAVAAKKKAASGTEPQSSVSAAA
jgi:hypothetical protein